jgi:hypothetical protein
MDEFEDLDFDLTLQQMAELECSIQDCNDGFYFTNVEDEEGHLTRELECNKCKRIGKMLERPFPHRFDCPMKRT